MPNETLTITDNRTQQTYEIPIWRGTIRATDLSQIREGSDDVGLMSYDPGFANTASCASRITFVDGTKGVLRYRGYPIEQLADRASFLEVAYLLLKGELPNMSELQAWEHDITYHTMVHENIRRFVAGFRYDAHPLGMLLSTVASLSTFYPESRRIGDPDCREQQIHRLIAKVPTLSAFAYRHSRGLPFAYPDNDLSYPGNFLNMLFKVTELKYEPNPLLERALDVLFIVYADHEQNCSANVLRSTASARTDPYAAAASAIASLCGPLHGGSSELVLQMLQRIGTKDDVPAFLQDVKERQEPLFGFGHWMYKSYDPRARILKDLAYKVFEVTGPNPLMDVALEVERVALQDDWFIERRLYPNVDFYSGLIYQSIGLPPAMFSVMFAIPRTAGWLAQWLELLDGEEQRLYRPRQVYVGPGPRDYVPLSRRCSET